ncbi:HD domain-containing phosphohydrolase [Pleionea sediminis]|uniref:HD domain-containing phosphohydrolase n=1 Tax=Pleionea sediminis TaxID=2569479 RepID=UPI001185BA5A|nr:HD domain-containing phosphohydrolase [Pleionea sediminis]
MNRKQESLQALSQSGTVNEKLSVLHKTVKEQHPFVARIAVALYDTSTGSVRTFAYSSDDRTPLKHYETQLENCHSLKKVAESKSPRVINDLTTYQLDSKNEHSKTLVNAGFESSYTLPMIWENYFFGFIFFNAKEKNVFHDRVLSDLDMIGHMITLIVFNERSRVRTLLATIKSALDITHSRDPETGNHIERMSRYARIIAREVAVQYQLDDAFVEHVYLFAPLHDIGKVKIPDSILLKNDKLTESEFEVMRTHSEAGKKLVEKLLDNYGLSGVTHIDMLKNIVLYHHEAIDGSGYPSHLKGSQIPLESRVVTVADIFDALTSERPYKKAWTNDEAFKKLDELAKDKVDPDCVAALKKHRDKVEQIQKHFQENPFG